MRFSIILLIACNGPAQTPDTLGGYDTNTGECVFPLRQTERPSWQDIAFNEDGSLRCGDYLACPSTSTARFGQENYYIEWTDYTFYGENGEVIASQPNTDGIGSDNPEDCFDAGITTWYGTPARDCLPRAGATRFTAPSCFYTPELTAIDATLPPGLLTGATTLDATTDLQTSQCMTRTTCPDGTTILSHVWGTNGEGGPSDDMWDRRLHGSADAFDSSGTLIGTADLTQRTYTGVFNAECLLLPSQPTEACQLLLPASPT